MQEINPQILIDLNQSGNVSAIQNNLEISQFPNWGNFLNNNRQCHLRCVVFLIHFFALIEKNLKFRKKIFKIDLINLSRKRKIF